MGMDIDLDRYIIRIDECSIWPSRARGGQIFCRGLSSRISYIGRVTTTYSVMPWTELYLFNLTFPSWESRSSASTSVVLDLRMLPRFWPFPERRYAFGIVSNSVQARFVFNMRGYSGWQCSVHFSKINVAALATSSLYYNLFTLD